MMQTTGKRLWKLLIVGIALVLTLGFPAEAAKQKASLRLNEKSVVMTVGKTKKLKATVKGKSKKVRFISSKPQVASVNSVGTIKAKKAGKTVITAKANGKTAKCTVTVKNPGYKELYRSFLSRNKITVNGYSFRPAYFRMLNIDRKGVPELIVTDQYFSPIITYYVYTVRGGRVCYLGKCALKGMSPIEPYVEYVSRYKGICTEGWINGVGGVYSYMYGISGKKLVLKQHTTEYHSGSDSYYIGKREKQSIKVSKSRALSFYNQYFKNKKKYKLYANTPSNLKRYL